MTDRRIPLEIHDLTVAYHEKPVLWNVDLAIGEGRLIGIVGPNGGGKTTLMKAVLGLVPLVSGWVQFYRKPYQEQRHLVGYVPQRESVDWDFPVDALDVVVMGRYRRLGWFRRPGQADRAAALACLEKMGMADFAHRQISQLSGGQQQRVFLARALAQEALVYFMDEPFAGVDAATEAAVITLLRELRSAGKTIVVVHHDLNTVETYFDDVLLLNGRVVAFGPTKKVFTSAHLHETYGGRLTVLDQVAQAVQAAKR